MILRIVLRLAVLQGCVMPRLDSLSGSASISRCCWVVTGRQGNLGNYVEQGFGILHHIELQRYNHALSPKP